MARIAYTDGFNKFWIEMQTIYKLMFMQTGNKVDAFKHYKKLDKGFDNKYLLSAARSQHQDYTKLKAQGAWQSNWPHVCRWLSKEIYLENMECETNDEDDTEHDDWEPVGF